MLKKSVFLVITLTIMLVIISGCKQAEYTYVSTYQYDDIYEKGLVLNINTKLGDIKIDNWSENEIWIEVTISGMANTELEAKELVENTSVDISHQDNSLNISGNYPEYDTPNTAVKIDYYIKIPENYQGNFVTSTGDIILDNIIGDLEVNTSTGKLFIINMEGNLKARLSTGDVIINHLAGQVDIETSTGEIHLDLSLLPETSNRLKTSTANIWVTLNEEVSTRITALTNTGDIIFNQEEYDEDEDFDMVIGDWWDDSTLLELISSTGDLIIYSY